MEIERTENEMENCLDETIVEVPHIFDDDNKTHVLSNNSQSSVEYLNLPLKLATDKKAYRGIKLANGLTAMLVADISAQVYSNSKPLDKNEDEKLASSQHEQDCDETLSAGPPRKRMKIEHEMAECGISVGVGNLNDPPEFPSLTRFLEHILVIGTKRYPEHFGEFANKCGGWYNAYTSAEKTTFKFAVPENCLQEALRRFAEIFGNPLFDEESVARVGRQFVALRDNVTIHEMCSQLRDLWECRYRPHNIIIAIEAKLPLDTLEEYVKESFSILSNGPLSDHFFEKFRAADLINISGFEKCYGIHLVSGTNNKIEFNWTMPSIFEPRSRRCFDYILSTMRDKGRGSLTSYLRRKNLCSDVSSEIVKTRSNSWLLILTLEVTVDGSEKTQEIMRSVYSYVNLIRKEGPQLRTYHEISQIEKTKARFTDETNPIDNAFDLCESMDACSPIYCEKPGDDSFDIDRLWIRACMDALIPENGNIVMFDRSNKDMSDLVEPWFKTKYTITELSKNTMQTWKLVKPIPELRLPEPNLFVAEDLSLISLTENAPTHPVKILSDSISEIWYLPQIVGPICHINVYYISPLPLASPQNATMLDMLVEVLKNLVCEELYPATVAGLHYSIESGEYGLIVKVNGFNDKLPLLVQVITKHISRCYTLVTKDLFKRTKNYLRDAYCADVTSNPKAMLEEIHRSLRRQVHWGSYDKLLAVPRIEYDRFVNFAKYFSDGMYIQCLVEGNMTSAAAIENVRKFIKMLRCRSLLPGTRPQLRTIEIPWGEHCCRIKNIETDGSSCVTNHYQIKIDPIKLSVLIEFLKELQKRNPSSGPAISVFDSQEGNDSCPLCSVSSVCGYSCTDDRAVYGTTEEIDEVIEMERHYYNELIKRMSEQDFVRAKDDLLNAKMNNYIHMDLPEDVSRNWSEIVGGRCQFDRATREYEVLKELTIIEMRKGLIDLTKDDSSLRKLSVQIVATGGGKINARKLKAENNGTPETKPIKTDKSPVSIRRTPVNSPIQYLTRLPNEKQIQPNDYYITDIVEYKQNLIVLPVHRTCKMSMPNNS